MSDEPRERRQNRIGSELHPAVRVIFIAFVICAAIATIGALIEGL